MEISAGLGGAFSLTSGELSSYSSGSLATLLIHLQDSPKVIDGLRFMLVQHPFNYFRNVEETHSTCQELTYCNLVSRVQSGGVGPTL